MRKLSGISMKLLMGATVLVAAIVFCLLRHEIRSELPIRMDSSPINHATFNGQGTNRLQNLSPLWNMLGNIQGYLRGYSLVRDGYFTSSFDSNQEVARLKAQILTSGSFIYMAKRQQHFQESGFDTKNNAEAAKKIVLADYSNKPDENSVTKRVVALHALRYSQHLKSDDCIRLMSSLITQYDSAVSVQHKRAVKFDIGSIAYMCAGIGEKKFLDMIDSLHVPALKAQCRNAMIIRAEDEERG